MRKQKHYTTEQEILDDIESAKLKADKLMIEAETLESRARSLQRQQNISNELAEQAAWWIDQAEKMREQAERINSTRLVRLKNTLSAFRTPSLPGVDVRDAVLEPK